MMMMSMLLTSFIKFVIFPSVICIALSIPLVIARYRHLRNSQLKEKKTYNISFIHPDLGIGGAENLVVNAAVALQSKGHTVTINTAHHDPTHCFEETRGKGPLANSIRVYGDTFLPTRIFTKFAALCANIRMLYVSLCIITEQLFLVFSSDGSNIIDCFFVDQVSLPNLILKVLGVPVIFYCHFPDKLLCQISSESHWLKKLYRMPLDWIEEFTTSVAPLILVNSKFTASIVSKAFATRLSNRSLKVLYPPVNVKDLTSQASAFVKKRSDDVLTFLSLNRYERKKNISLAIKALVELRSLAPLLNVRLIVAGGYDRLNAENVEHLKELRDIAQTTCTDDQIQFLTSVSNEKKIELLATATAVLYTPENEHFGIVPVEAMCVGTPVIAVNSGGPVESVLDGKTGFLCPSNATDWAVAMKKVIENKTSMGSAGKKRVDDLFSLDAFTKSLDSHVRELVVLMQ